MFAATEKETAKEKKTGRLVFKHLPGFAKFLLENHLVDYIKEQLAISKEINLPMLKYFLHIPEDQLIEMSIPSHTDFLMHMIGNRLEEQVETSLQRWVEDQLEVIGRDEVSAEDITLASLMRDKAMLKFVPLYTTDPNEIIALVNEMHSYTTYSETASINTYIKILQGRINEHTHFIESVANTTPSIIYVYDRVNQRELYTNNKMTELLGFTEKDLQEKNNQIIQFLVHPDDIERLLENEKKFNDVKDGEIRSIEYRIRDKRGHYRWMRAYESVFKRNHEGVITEKIGVAIDIDEQKRAEDELVQRESQLLEAQQLVNMGSYIWDIENDKLTVTPQYLEIFEITGEPDRSELIKGVHPGDRERLKESREKAVRENGIYECEYRHIVNGREKVIWARGSVTQQDGRKLMKGTVLDVTDRHYMIQRLLRSEALYKQAQALAGVGNWVWDFTNNRIEWSDELYNIYGMEPGTEVDYNLIKTFNHPDDDERINSLTADAMTNNKAFDYVYRIRLRDGIIKTVHARGEAMVGKDGKIFKMLGTVQDITEKQTLLEQLQKSDKLFKQAQSISHVGNWQWDIGENKITWSDELYNIFGLAPQSEEIVFERYTSFIHPGEREAAINTILDSLKTLQPFENTYNAILEDGTRKIILSRGEVETGHNGEPIRMNGICQDVTDKHDLISQLRKNEQLYKEAQALAHLGNFSHNLETNEIAWTDEIYRIYGMEPQVEPMTYDKVIAFIHPDDREHVLTEMNAAIREKRPYDCKYKIQLRDGNIRVVHRKAEVVYDGTGKAVKMNGTMQDITKEYFIEQALIENREFIEKIANTTPSLIASYNVKTGKYTYINSAFEKILGYPAQRVMDEGMAFFLDIIHPDDLPVIMEKNAAALEEANREGAGKDPEMIAEFKYRLRHNDGYYRWFHTYGTVFDRDDLGKVEHVLNVSVDITEQEEAEQEVYRKNLQLQQSNASLEEYAYVASHDLKEPLRKISTFGDRLLSTQYDSLSEDGKLYLEKIISSSRRMQAMISDLLSISLLSGDKTYEPYNLHTIVQEVIQTLEYKIEEKGAVIISDNLPEANIVPSQFRQLFQNLVSNSLKFVKEGITPQVHITHRFLKPGEVQQYELAKAKKYLEVQVADNGIGFDNQFANKIFTIFQRLHGRNEYEGTGIGLAICKKIAENHGGTIIAESLPGQGATFTIIIPA